jgi:hypothetical protein
MGLFKSKDERRIEREMKVKAGMRSIERSIRQQEKFSEDFIKNAAHAKQIGDDGQYPVHPLALKKTAAVKKMLERQLLAIKNAMLISQQAQASAQFAESMNVMARQIADIFGEMDLTKTQAQWEKAVTQAGSMEERMELFLDSMEDAARSGAGVASDEGRPGHRRRDRPNDPGRGLGEREGGVGEAGRAGSEIAKELGAAKQKD